MIKGWCVLACTCLIVSVDPAHSWGKKDKDDEPKMPGGKDAANLGLDGIRHLARDPSAMAALLEEMQDPETMAEVEKLMKDKKFQKEMEKMTKSKDFQDALQGAEKLLNDPTAAARIQAQLKQQAEAYTNFLEDGPGVHGELDAEIGMDYMRTLSQNPSMINEAAALLQDPETMAQVEALMKNPDFQRRMKEVSSHPQFKNAMAQASQMLNDPEAREYLEREASRLYGARA